MHSCITDIYNFGNWLRNLWTALYGTGINRCKVTVFQFFGRLTEVIRLELLVLLHQCLHEGALRGNGGRLEDGLEGATARLVAGHLKAIDLDKGRIGKRNKRIIRGFSEDL